LATFARHERIPALAFASVQFAQKRKIARVRFDLGKTVSFTEGQERFKQSDFNSNLTRD
jgi:hypothetical protein